MQHWQAPSDATLARWRREFPSANGIAGLTVVDAMDGSTDWAERAAALVHREGFACVANLLELQLLEQVRAEAVDMIADVLAQDTLGGVNGHHRYSLGGCSATGACLHHKGWASLVGLPKVDAVLTAVWGRWLSGNQFDGLVNRTHGPEGAAHRPEPSPEKEAPPRSAAEVRGRTMWWQ